HDSPSHLRVGGAIFVYLPELTTSLPLLNARTPPPRHPYRVTTVRLWRLPPGHIRPPCARGDTQQCRNLRHRQALVATHAASDMACTSNSCQVPLKSLSAIRSMIGSRS